MQIDKDYKERGLDVIDDGKIVLHAQISNRSQAVTLAEEWELADAGKTLKVKRVESSKEYPTDVEMLWVFRRKS